MDTNGVLELTKKQVRRSWSGEEKRSICAQTIVPGVSVAQVARRYVMNDNMVFNWLKKPHFQPEELTSCCHGITVQINDHVGAY
ncbi:transposase [Ahrensia sp. AH-315-G08]|nr:transposase [Ahrensia sp. AH-315-G08]